MPCTDVQMECYYICTLYMLCYSSWLAQEPEAVGCNLEEIYYSLLLAYLPWTPVCHSRQLRNTPHIPAGLCAHGCWSVHRRFPTTEPTMWSGWFYQLRSPLAVKLGVVYNHSNRIPIILYLIISFCQTIQPWSMHKLHTRSSTRASLPKLGISTFGCSNKITYLYSTIALNM